MAHSFITINACTEIEVCLEEVGLLKLQTVLAAKVKVLITTSKIIILLASAVNANIQAN